MNKMLFIYGAGGLGRQILDTVCDYNDKTKTWNSISFIDDCVNSTLINNVKVFRSNEFYTSFNAENAEIIIAMGEPYHRLKIYNEILTYGFNIATFYAESSEISKYAKLDNGVIVDRKSIISTNVAIGTNTYINRGVIIGHDVVIGKNCVICPGVVIGGKAVIKDNTFIGSSATIRDNITIGEECILGMGSVVVSSIEDKKVALGNPAKVVKNNTSKIVFTGRK